LPAGYRESGCFSKSPLALSFFPTFHDIQPPTSLTSPVGPGLAPHPGMVRSPGSRPDHLPTRRPNRRDENEDPTARAGPGSGAGRWFCGAAFQDFSARPVRRPIVPRGGGRFPETTQGSGLDSAGWHCWLRGMTELGVSWTLFLGWDETKGFASRCWVTAGSMLVPGSLAAPCKHDQLVDLRQT
jgi:hypothetical protein